METDSSFSVTWFLLYLLPYYFSYSTRNECRRVIVPEINRGSCWIWTPLKSLQVALNESDQLLNLNASLLLTSCVLLVRYWAVALRPHSRESNMVDETDNSCTHTRTILRMIIPHFRGAFLVEYMWSCRSENWILQVKISWKIVCCISVNGLRKEIECNFYEIVKDCGRHWY